MGVYERVLALIKRPPVNGHADRNRANVKSLSLAKKRLEALLKGAR